jgi:hypothetical protein
LLNVARLINFTGNNLQTYPRDFQSLFLQLSPSF